MDYGKTLNLPQTDFPMKANLPVKEQEILKNWENIQIYFKMIKKNSDKNSFIMHDGPPYANGSLHDGHVLNKILKDIVVKYKNMSGHLATFRPGWDCHGLPIELKVAEKLGSKKKEMSKSDFLKECKNFAINAIDIQRKEFKRLGVFADWEKPYTTLSPEYEGCIAHQFANVVESGALFKSKKPVHWCPSCETALAEAEIEYEDHTSPSIYVKFPLIDKLMELENKSVNFVIWTTTPWTLPANLAIALHPEIEYSAVKFNEEVFIIASALKEKFLAATGHSDAETVMTFNAMRFEGMKTKHPFIDRESVIVYADYVTTDTGTGCVHTAPGHGADDYLTGLKYGLPAYAPVDDRGVLTEDVPYFSGLHVFKANPVIVEHLFKEGFLLNKPGEMISHSYPHCWRCHKPVIFRATEQWFISMDETNLRKRCLEEIEKVELIPEWGRKRITPMLENSLNWCVSRQRLWGVPIIAFSCSDCGEKIVDGKIAHKVADEISVKGVSVWHEKEPSEFLPEGFTCPKCSGRNIKKESDILDVWFDSGVSWAAVLDGSKGYEYPCDLYLEGSDQHRGWFQSSLKLSVLIKDKAPYKKVLTHGFVVDGKGEKLSKSKGNFVPPDKRINTLGAEILRLWVAAEDYRDDIRISDNIIEGFATAYRKIRNTMRFMFGFINDFDPDTMKYDINELTSLDKWAYLTWKSKLELVLSKYENFEFHRVYHEILDFFTVAMSSVYLDIIKDRYTMKADDPRRRKSQFTVYQILKDVITALAPILSFTSEEAYGFLKGDKKESVFLEDMPAVSLNDEEKGFLKKWDVLLKVREAVQKQLETLRMQKTIGHSLDAAVDLYFENIPLLDEELNSLESIFIVSGVDKAASSEGLQKVEDISVWMSVRVAPGEKCPRCWKKRELKNFSDELQGICESCYEAVR
ncbi:MAG TPA: isoleucine--tRNA ligase [bacterium]|nr:isoleucine--tRNA ligase [bacterium]